MKLTEGEMLAIAKKYTGDVETQSGIAIVLIDAFTIKKPYGYVFFYTGKKYYETRDDKMVWQEMRLSWWKTVQVML